MRKALVVPASAIAFLLFAQTASACSVCFGDPSAPSTKGLSNAILFLLGTVGFVQIAFVALFFAFWRRARAMKRSRESLQVLDGGAR